MSANGNKATSNNVVDNAKKLSQLSTDERDAALKLLEDAEAEVKADDGAPVNLDLDEETSKHVRVRIDKRVLDLIDAKDARRQLQEEIRANHRNFNRTLTLVLTIMIGLVVTWTLPHLGPFGKTLQPYAFIITITMDLLVTGWAYYKHY